MSETNNPSEMNPTTEDFAALLEESFAADSSIEGSVVKGRVTAVENDLAIIDVGLKTEGRVPLREFAMAGQAADINVGDEVEVFVDRIENAMGEAVLSRDKARREESWVKLEKSFEAEERVEGVIFGRVKGGFTVDLDGATAFLPGSQVDIRPVRDITPLMNTPQPFQILKMDRRRGNILVSRRAVLEESRAEARSELVANLQECQVLQGVVKNITDYGAFVDLGGLDGLLHITDISWSRVTNPAEFLNLGDEIDVKILSFDKEKLRVSLGLKQIQNDPWENVESNYAVGGVYEASVSNITDYGCFAQLEEGIEGLIHLSELDWTSKNIHPSKVVEMDQKIKVMILEIDHDKRRISLGLKQTKANPWTEFANKYGIGDKVDGQIKSITDFGIFVGLEGDIDGLIHLSDISEDEDPKEALEQYKKGDKLDCIVFAVDAERERISLKLSE